MPNVANEYIYLGHDNTIDLILKADGTAQDLSGVTKITATFGSTLIESTDKASGLITWDQSGYDTGEIRLDLGQQSLTADTYTVPIVVYDATYTNGVVWEDIRIVVKPEVEAS